MEIKRILRTHAITTSLTNLLRYTSECISFFFHSKKIRLLVIDSIAYFFRQFTDMIERSVKLYEAIQCLMHIVKKYSICVEFDLFCSLDHYHKSCNFFYSWYSRINYWITSSYSTFIKSTLVAFHDKSDSSLYVSGWSKKLYNNEIILFSYK